MNSNNKLKPLAYAIPLAISVGLTACGGGGGSSTTSTTTTDTTTSRGYTLPSEISAVPASSSSTTANAANFSNAIRQLSRAADASGLPADSDYVKTKGKTFVEEPALEQFDIIETILNALTQTNYADEVGNGAYQAVVSWEEDRDGVDIKQLQTWTVKSELVDGTHPVSGASQKVNVVQLWIPETDPETGDETLIKAQAEIYTSATVADDGSFDDYGEWDLNVYFDADPTAVDTADPQGYFAASSRIGSDGKTTLKVLDRGMRNEFQLFEEMKGVLVRSAGEGYGVVEHPDWESCYKPSADDYNRCDGLSAGDTFPSDTAKYSYTPGWLVVKENGNTEAYKDRDLSGAVKMVHRYGLFYAEADTDANITEGENVEKKVNFGFPVKYQSESTDGSNTTFEAWGYYGAWQGRHELWGPEGFVVDNGVNPAPTVFTKADVPPNQTNVPTYTLAEFAGTFTKRKLVDAKLDDIQGVPVQTRLNKNYDLLYINSAWRRCVDGKIDWTNYPTSVECVNHDGSSKSGSDFGFTEFVDWSQLMVGQNDERWVYIDSYDENTQTNKQYVYLNDTTGADISSGYTTPGFYEASGNNKDQNTGRILADDPATKLPETAGAQVFVNISGQIFIEYVGNTDGSGNFTNPTTGWMQKEYTGEDPVSRQPTFGSGDTPFSPSRDEEYYINAAGSNYIVKRKDTADKPASYDVKRELQNAANPDNTNSSTSASILPSSTSYLAAPWNKQVKYTLVENPSDGNYLLLEVLSDDSDSSNDGTVADTQWGLFAYNSSGKPLAIVDGSVTAVEVDDYGFPDPNFYTDPNNMPRPVEFNWEKPSDSQNWGKQRFLKKQSDDSYVILSNPISLNGVAVEDSAGNDKGTLDLQFDGWMHGMPDMYHELEQNGWEMTPDIAGKVVHIPAGTPATGDDGTGYFVKPLETSLFLGVASNNGDDIPINEKPLIADADSVDLTSLPTYTAHDMGAVPTGTSIKYTEGKAVE